jgi:membrane-associated protease RseP (regulator of RpoE activity)
MRLIILSLFSLAFFSSYSVSYAGEASDAQTPAVVAPAPKPFLGVNVDESASSFDPNQGLPVTAVIPGSTAATMGIQVGDLLKSFNGQAIKAHADLARAIGAVKVGDAITIELQRKTDDKLVAQKLNGTIAVRPQVTTISNDLAKLREEMLSLRRQQEERKTKELSLADMLKMLKEIEEGMPAAVADFKKQYPKGEFNIQINISIVSDKSAKDPITVGNQPGAQLTGENAQLPADVQEAQKAAQKAAQEMIEKAAEKQMEKALQNKP